MEKKVVYGFTQTQRRIPDLSASCACVFIDVQHYTCHRSSPLAATERDNFDSEYFYERVERICRPNWARLIAACRLAELDIVTTVISSLRPDGKDLSLDYKKTGFFVYAKYPPDELLDELSPASPNEICLPKSSSSVFQSTHIDYILRNLGVKTVVLAGVLTDQCIDHAVRDAADLGYSVIVVEDACATGSQLRHDNAIAAFKGYTDEIMSTEAVIKRIQHRNQKGPITMITGFGPFGSVESNPTEAIIKQVEIDGAMARVLDVTLEDVDQFVAEELEPLLRTSKAVHLLHLGVAETASEYRLERAAYNECMFRIPDMNGCQPEGQTIDMDGPAVLTSTAPLERILHHQAIKNRGIKSLNISISDDPGRYVCNYLYYRSLAACAASGAKTRTVFLHVPLTHHADIEEQVSVVKSVCEALRETPDLPGTSHQDLGLALPLVQADPVLELELNAVALDDESIDDRLHAEIIRKSLKSHGFFVVRPTFPFSIVLENASAHKAFFALPLELKEEISLNESFCGYHGYQSERLDPRGSSCGDLREGIYFRRPNVTRHPLSGENQWPSADSGLPGYRQTVEAFMESLTELGSRIVGLIALSLGLDQHAFDEYFTDPMITLRPICYSGASDEDAGRFACGAHTDYGFITLLHADGPGLQIRKNGRWRDVALCDGALIVNIGDMCERICGGVYKSTEHRVVNKDGKLRFSMPLFFEPNFYASIPVLGGKSDGTDRTMVVSGEYLLDKYSQTHEAVTNYFYCYYFF